MFGRRHAVPQQSAVLCFDWVRMKQRKWLALIVSFDLASDRPMKSWFFALIRARFCELLAPEAGLEPPNGEYFILGLFFTLDAMFSRPLADIF